MSTATEAASGAEARTSESVALDELAGFVLDQTGRPVDMLAVAATLESRGIRDVDAQDVHGENDVFALAEDVYGRCLRLSGPGSVEARKPTAVARSQTISTALRWYGQGAVKSLPIVLQTAAVIVLGYAMWSSLTFDRRLASTVAVATILSFFVTGGFVQAISQLSIYYRDQRSYVLARTISWRLFRGGLAGAVVVGTAVLALEAVGSWVPIALALVGGIYYLLLSGLWLALSILYALERHLAVIVVFALGTAVVTGAQLLTTVSIVTAHLVGLCFAVSAASAYAGLSLRRLAGRADTTARLARLPRLTLLAFGVAPYFWYGIAYFGFLFLDRLIAWSTGTHPLPIWLDTPYEYGLDFALLAFVLTLPQLEYSVHKFSGTLVAVQESFDGTDATGHNAHFVRFYFRQVGALAAVGLVSTALMWWGLTALRGTDGAFNLASPGPVTFGVFAWGVVGYLLLALGLMNGVFLFSLSRPTAVLSALSLAVFVDLGLGWWLSRHLSYWYAIVGMTAGALVFAAVTCLAAVRVLKQLDYYYYSAY
ncbi:MAG: hypothetical protein H0V07_13430 [Propionibacteriales bacterium]|nr:hypothetical protein [Propionibacteriales bacterium]